MGVSGLPERAAVVRCLATCVAPFLGEADFINDEQTTGGVAHMLKHERAEVIAEDLCLPDRCPQQALHALGAVSPMVSASCQPFFRSTR